MQALLSLLSWIMAPRSNKKNKDQKGKGAQRSNKAASSSSDAAEVRELREQLKAAEERAAQSEKEAEDASFKAEQLLNELRRAQEEAEQLKQQLCAVQATAEAREAELQHEVGWLEERLSQARVERDDLAAEHRELQQQVAKSAGADAPPSAAGPGAMVEIGFGCREQAALLAGMEVAAELVVGQLLGRGRRLRVMDSTYSQSVQPTMSQLSPPEQQMALGFKLQERVTHEAVSVAQQHLRWFACRDVRQQVHGWLQQQQVGELDAAPIHAALEQLEAQVYRATYVAAVRAARLPASPPASAMERTVREFAVSLADVVSSRLELDPATTWAVQGALRTLAHDTLQLELLRRALARDVPGLVVVCAEHAGQPFDPARMEAPIRELQVPGLDRPFVFSCLRAGLEAVNASGQRAVLAKAAVALAVPAPAPPPPPQAPAHSAPPSRQAQAAPPDQQQQSRVAQPAPAQQQQQSRGAQPAPAQQQQQSRQAQPAPAQQQQQPRGAQPAPAQQQQQPRVAQGSAPPVSTRQPPASSTAPPLPPHSDASSHPAIGTRAPLTTTAPPPSERALPCSEPAAHPPCSAPPGSPPTEAAPGPASGHGNAPHLQPFAPEPEPEPHQCTAPSGPPALPFERALPSGESAPHPPSSAPLCTCSPPPDWTEVTCSPTSGHGTAPHLQPFGPEPEPQHHTAPSGPPAPTSRSHTAARRQRQPGGAPAGAGGPRHAMGAA